MAAIARPLIEFDPWPSSIDQAATPANRNTLRAEVIALPAISFEATQPVSPDEGELYALSAAWGDEVAGTLAYFRDGVWSYWVPYVGQIKRIGVVFYEYQPDSSGEWYSLFGGLGDFADDTAAASGSVVLDQLYRTGSTLKVRIA